LETGQDFKVSGFVKTATADTVNFDGTGQVELITEFNEDFSIPNDNVTNLSPKVIEILGNHLTEDRTIEVLNEQGDLVSVPGPYVHTDIVFSFTESGDDATPGTIRAVITPTTSLDDDFSATGNLSIDGNATIVGSVTTGHLDVQGSITTSDDIITIGTDTGASSNIGFKANHGTTSAYFTYEVASTAFVALRDSDEGTIGNHGTNGSKLIDIIAKEFKGVATTAKYADVAERYETDMPLLPGDVVMIGGAKEITKTTQQRSEDVFGVISTNPGFKMNSDAGDDDTHPYVALTGRIPCKVIGTVKKGDRLVTSDTHGVAMSEKGLIAFDLTVSDRMVIGRSLVDKTTSGIESIEIVIR